MKRTLPFFYLLSIVLLFAACGSSSEGVKEEVPEATEAKVETQKIKEPSELPEQETEAEQEPITKPSFDWLLGDWIRLGEKDGKETFEHWEKISDESYKGFGFTLLGKDTVWQEKMRWGNFEGQWLFAVIAGKDSDQTLFVSTSIEEKRFTVENHTNEFPQKIVYYYEDDRLKATISGGGPVIDFEFAAYKGSLY